MLLRVVVEGLVGRHVDARVGQHSPRVEAVDDVEQFAMGVFHGTFIVTPRPVYRFLSWFPALS
jgi:hypothetical protein